MVESELVASARSVGGMRLQSLPRRWAHVQGVAASAASVAPLVDAARAGEIVTACWLHDVGYADEVAATGLHPVDGARFARALGFPPLVVSLIAYHTGAEFEAAERGLSDALAEFERPPKAALDVVTYADLTTAVDGLPIKAEDRLAEILDRYQPGDPVHRAVTKSAPALRASVARVEDRLRMVWRSRQPR